MSRIVLSLLFSTLSLFVHAETLKPIGFLLAAGKTTAISKHEFDLGPNWEIRLRFGLWHANTLGSLAEIRFSPENALVISMSPASEKIGSQVYVFSKFLGEVIGRFEVASNSLSRLDEHELRVGFSQADSSLSLSFDGEIQQLVMPDLLAHGEAGLIIGSTAPLQGVLWDLRELRVLNIAEDRRGNWVLTDPSGAELRSDFSITNSLMISPGLAQMTLQRLDDSRDVFFPPTRDGSFLLVVPDEEIHQRNLFSNPTIHLGAVSKQHMADEVWYWNSYRDTLYTFICGHNPLVAVTPQKHPVPPRTDDLHYGSSIIAEPATGSLIQVGGYGRYAYRSDIAHYDFEDRKWTTFETGNESYFSPRAGAGITLLDSNNLFIFSGYGNPSGIQAMGGDWYTDLWLYDFRRGQLSQMGTDLLDLNAVSQEGRLQAIEVIYRPDDKCLYGIVVQHAKGSGENQILQLFKLSTAPVAPAEFLKRWDLSGIYMPGSFSYNESNDALLFAFYDEAAHKPYSYMSCFPLWQWGNPIENDVILNRIFIYPLAIVLVFGSLIWLGLAWRGFEGADQATPKIHIEVDAERVLSLIVNGKLVDLEAIKLKKSLKLLAMISAQPGQRLSHADIRYTLWPHVTDHSFINSLNVTLSTIRKAFEPYREALQQQGGFVALSPRLVKVKNVSKN